MTELLTQDEIKAFYDKLLITPEYIKTMQKSLNGIKIEQILSFAKRVNREAGYQLKQGYKENSQATKYVKEILDFEFPAFPQKNFDYSGFSYDFKLNYWLKTSEAIIKLLRIPFKPGDKKLLNIPTNAKPEEILKFWLGLGNNKKGNPCWTDREEIKHFVYQNFEGFTGVTEEKIFTPDMTKTELSKKTYDFFTKYGIYGTKPQYVKLLQLNFKKFKGTNPKTIYANIAFK